MKKLVPVKVGKRPFSATILGIVAGISYIFSIAISLVIYLLINNPLGIVIALSVFFVTIASSALLSAFATLVEDNHYIATNEYKIVENEETNGGGIESFGWQCKKCGSLNEHGLTVCKFCSTKKK